MSLRISPRGAFTLEATKGHLEQDKARHLSRREHARQADVHSAQKAAGLVRASRAPPQDLLRAGGCLLAAGVADAFLHRLFYFSSSLLLIVFTCPSVSLYLPVGIYLSVYLSVCLLCLYVCPSIYLFVLCCFSLYLFIYCCLSTCASTCLSS